MLFLSVLTVGAVAVPVAKTIQVDISFHLGFIGLQRERERRQMPHLTLVEHTFTHRLKRPNQQLRLGSDQKAP